MPVIQQFIVEVAGETHTLSRPEAEQFWVELSAALNMQDDDRIAAELEAISLRTYDIANAITELENAVNGHWLQSRTYDSGEEFLESLDEEPLPAGPASETISVEEAMARLQVQAAVQDSVSTARSPNTGIGSGHG